MPICIYISARSRQKPDLVRRVVELAQVLRQIDSSIDR